MVSPARSVPVSIPLRSASAPVPSGPAPEVAGPDPAGEVSLASAWLEALAARDQDDRFMDRRPEAGTSGQVSLVSYGDRQKVAADGTPLPDPKGGPGKSSYHTMEMALLGREVEQ